SITSGLRIFSIIEQRLQDLLDVCIIGPFMSIPFIEENDQTLARREHLEALQALVGNAYPNKFERSHVVDPEREDTITAIVDKFRDLQSSKEAPEELNKFVVRLAGRI